MKLFTHFLFFTNLRHALLLPYNTEIEELKKEKVQLKMILYEADENKDRLEVENNNLNKQYKLMKDFANQIEDRYKEKKT
jgi:FtsZ-binding cell division protein ZapB